MTIELWTLGKQQDPLTQAATDVYVKRINKYYQFKITNIDNSKINKDMPKSTLLKLESELVLKKIQSKDMLIVLDENGKKFTSTKFAHKLNLFFNLSPNRMIFLIGGSFGIDNSLKEKSQLIMSMSDFTFPHQLIKLIFVEQLYRCCTILNNEKYHHE